MPSSWIIKNIANVVIQEMYIGFTCVAIDEKAPDSLPFCFQESVSQLFNMLFFKVDAYSSPRGARAL